jgi:hypothetical protein
LVIILRSTERLVGSLRAGNRSIDAQEEVSEVASQAETSNVVRGEGASEDREALLGHIGVPVANPDVVIETTAAERSASKLLVVCGSVVGVCLGVDDKVDSTGGGGRSLEARERCC